MTPAERELKALAEKATPFEWSSAEVFFVDGLHEEAAAYIAACSPERVLALLLRVERLEAALAEFRAFSYHAEEQETAAHPSPRDEDDDGHENDPHPDDCNCVQCERPDR